jgi:tetratricopeptide (TPR) repeat protein
MRAERIESIRGAEAALELLEGTDSLDLTQPANAEVLRVKARLLLSSGRADDALIATRAALDAAPEAGPFHEIHATVLAATKADPTRVRAAFERAVELSPEDWISLESLGRNREEAGDLEEALSLYRRAAAAAPDQTSPGRAIANTLAGMGRTAESEAAWEAQLREQPWDAEAAIALVSQRIAAGRLDDRTVELAERAVLFLGGAEAEQQLIEVHRARGETDRAQALEHAMAERTPLAPTRITPVDTL